MDNNNNKYMQVAIEEARKAFDKNEVPIGAVIIHDNKIIAKAHNMRGESKNTLYHAELIAINEACKILGDWRLEDCTIYITVEPCAMCAGAILQARIKNLVFGAPNIKSGCAGSILNIFENDKFNHKVNVYSGVMETECVELMISFFKNFR